MDAGVLEIAVEKQAFIRTPTKSGSPDWLRTVLWATIAVGVLWRLVRYVEGFPIWGDEAMLLLNLLDRDYAGLTEHLQFNQVAPLLFLWIEKTALLILGPSEWSLHLLPFLAGLGALGLFWRTCRNALSPTIAGFALAILAVSYYPVRHGCEVKPYAFDLLGAVVFAWLALGHLRQPTTMRWLIGLVVAAPIAVFSSYPSVFVGGAVSVVLLPTVGRASWRQRSLYLLFNVALGGSFLIHLLLVGKEASDAEAVRRTNDFLRMYWKDAFPPDSILDWPLWLIKVFTGNVLAYPLGANRGGSTGTFLLAALGAFSLWRTGRRSLLALCVLPFTLNLLAAILGKYPFGDSARITLHLAPFICVLMAHGLAQMIDWIRIPVWQTRLHLAILVMLLACGIGGAARDLVRPFKTEHDHDVRQLVRDLREQVKDDPVLLCHPREERLIAEFLWYYRTQTWRSGWLDKSPIQAGDSSCWLIQCANEPLTVGDLMARFGADDWLVIESAERKVPPENSKMPPLYCRWVHLVRATKQPGSQSP